MFLWIPGTHSGEYNNEIVNIKLHKMCLFAIKFPIPLNVIKD